jgi:hypothetical protein
MDSNMVVDKATAVDTKEPEALTPVQPQQEIEIGDESYGPEPPVETL